MVKFPFLDNIKSLFGKETSVSSHPAISINDMESLSASTIFQSGGAGNYFHDGNKFLGGLGAPQIVWTDYWSLRLHSTKLFKENIYARGIIRRLVTNEINKGLTLEATPDAKILGIPEDVKTAWTENTERRFKIYAKSPLICDFKKRSTFGALQRAVRMEALVSGDVLVVLRKSQQTKRSAIQIISGDRVQTPLGHTPRKGNKIIHGVEIDGNGVHVAYWVIQEDRTSKRLPVIGERTGRKIAWLVYGTDKRHDEVRGEPILALALQSIKELDRYRDSTQRKAVINSMLAMFIEKTSDKMGTLPMSSGATKRSAVDLSNPDGSTRKFEIQDHIPGLVLEELQEGEKPVGFGSAGIDTNFGLFETSIINGLAWGFEIPPEILTLAFQNNYSASRAAVNEFKMYLDKSRSERAEEFDEPVYQTWLIDEVLTNKISAPKLIEAWGNPLQYDIFGAWVSSDWSGAIKPSVDLKKEVSGYTQMIKIGAITRDRATAELTGTKFDNNVERLKVENEKLADAMRPLLELEKEFGPGAVENATTAMEKRTEEIVEETTERVLSVVSEGDGG